MTARYGTRSRCRFSAFSRARLRPGVSRFVITAAILCNQQVPELLAAPASIEYSVKAAYLLNFTKFVDWPENAFTATDAPLTICLLGDDPFGRVIDQIVEGESVNGHRIAVERMRTDQQRSCQVAYIGNNGTMPAAFSAPGAAVLTVGEGDDFIHQGGIIGFIIDSRHVRFDINLKAATTASLKLSSKMLSVARSVER